MEFVDWVDNGNYDLAEASHSNREETQSDQDQGDPKGVSFRVCVCVSLSLSQFLASPRTSARVCP